MMKSKSIFFTTILIAGLVFQLKAQVRPAHIFDNNMVLQRDLKTLRKQAEEMARVRTIREAELILKEKQ